MPHGDETACRGPYAEQNTEKNSPPYFCDADASELVISESGIKTSNDVERLEEIGVDAILVGETLLKDKDPGLAILDLLAKLLSIFLAYLIAFKIERACKYPTGKLMTN